jgi:hypothetical protein
MVDSQQECHITVSGTVHGPCCCPIPALALRQQGRPQHRQQPCGALVAALQVRVRRLRAFRPLLLRDADKVIRLEPRGDAAQYLTSDECVRLWRAYEANDAAGDAEDAAAAARAAGAAMAAGVAAEGGAAAEGRAAAEGNKL